MDDLKIDGHKLLYHPGRVSNWLGGAAVYPIYMEISPTARCNHRCVFCAFDYVEYPDRSLETGRLKRIIAEIAGLGVKSIMYAGEGEPFLHPDMAKIIAHTKRCGIDTAVATNATLLTPAAADACLGSLAWMRVSMNAGTPLGYAFVHGTSEKMFHKAVDNLKYAVELKRREGLGCTIGAQLVLVGENMGEVLPLAELLSEAGADYLTVKPCVSHPLSRHGRAEECDPAEIERLHGELEKFENENFKIVFRRHSFRKLAAERQRYGACHGINFFAEIASDGEVYTCGPFLGVKEHSYGNINESSFREIWEGERRKKVLRHVSELDVGRCMPNCRLDEINLYLWQLLNPPDHVNFI
ncbi:MAG: radical SAM protein [bacterium]